MYTEHEASAVDVQTIMREIRIRVRETNRERYDAIRIVRKTVPPQLFSSMARLKAATISLQELADRIGEIPPGPSTPRARVGAAMVRLAQRALFWLLPPLRTTHQMLAQTLRDHVKATDDMLRILQQTNVQLEMLRRSSEKVQTCPPVTEDVQRSAS
jgi:hypothetical protein